MFGFLKNVFKRKEAETMLENGSFSEAPAEAVQEYIEPPLELPPPRTQRNGHANGRGLALPLEPILHALPLELQPRVKCPDASDMTVCVPLEKILSQLARGVVKISFGELRQAAPQAFTPANDRDRVMVTLPLGDILAQLNPALITRRRVQKQVEVPEEISSPFEAENQNLIFAIGPARPETPPAPTPNPRAITPTTPTPTLPPRITISSAPAPIAPSASPEPPTFIPGPRSLREPATTKPGPIKLTLPQTEKPAPEKHAPEKHAPEKHAPEKHAAEKHAPEKHAPEKHAPEKTEPQAEPLTVGLTSLADAWPDSVRQEIVHLNLVDAKVALPTEVIERALKQGRIAFTWKAIRSWIRPPTSTAGSPSDGAVLELPLKVVAPLFLARQREAAKAQQPVAIDENIPNLFFGFPQPDPAGHSVARATAKPADTNYYVWDDSADTVRVTESETKRGPTPGTDFVTKYATPNEIVSRAAGLEGVEGALIALPDGLMVASRLPTELNGDTLAAFLPQIYGKVSQCTKELRLGELNNLNFTVGNVPWKIFRVNALFFAAFGTEGAALPTSQLAALAAELDHKPK